jgi:hypothetical protein
MAVGGRRPSKAAIQTFRCLPAQLAAARQLRKFTPAAQFSRKRSSSSCYRAKPTNRRDG